MKLCFLLVFNFFVFSFLTAQPTSNVPPSPYPHAPQREQPQQQQRLNLYDRHPYERHPYTLQPYEPHVLPSEEEDEADPLKGHPNPFDPDEVSRDRRGSSYTAANAQAIYWLNLVDQAQYGASWLEAGSLLKDLVTQEQWAGAMGATRGDDGVTCQGQENTIQGTVIRGNGNRNGRANATRNSWGYVTSRKASSHQLIQRLPNGSRGNFMVIKYKTNFSEKYGAVETVILASEGPLKLWKVISYKVGRQ